MNKSLAPTVDCVSLESSALTTTASMKIAADRLGVTPVVRPTDRGAQQATSPVGHMIGRVLSLIRRVPAFRAKYRETLVSFQRGKGHCYMCKVPDYLACDKGGASPLILFEESIPLNCPRAVHNEIEDIGNGRYSHWQGWLLFSTSDNTDPATNGRLYTVREV